MFLPDNTVLPGSFYSVQAPPPPSLGFLTYILQLQDDKGGEIPMTRETDVHILSLVHWCCVHLLVIAREKAGGQRRKGGGEALVQDPDLKSQALERRLGEQGFPVGRTCT